MSPAASTAVLVPRSHDRLPLCVPVQFRCARGEAEGQTLNISKSGMFVETRHPRSPGECLFFRVQVGDSKPMFFHLEAQVVWAKKRANRFSKAPAGMGVKFLPSRTQTDATLDGIFSILNGIKS